MVSTQIPLSYKIPGTGITVDPSQAGTPINRKFALITGHRTTAGAAPTDVPIAVGTQADADALCGPGSMAARMWRTFFGICKTVPIFILPIAEPASGVAATGTVTVAAAPSVAGTLPLYVAGQLVSVGIIGSDSTASVAGKIAAAINAATDLPVTAAASGAVVTLTAKWKGLTGNDIRVEDSLLGFYGGEALPAGLALTYPSGNVLSGGTGVPDLTSAIANIGDDPYKFVALPFNDSGSFSVFDVEYGFSQSGRWGWLRQSYGQIFSARRDTYAGLMTWGPSNNSAVISPMAVEPRVPSPTWEVAAAYAASAALSIVDDPARPLQTLPLLGIRPASKAARFSKTQLNALAQVGLAIQGTDLNGASTGVPQILREQTSYQRNTQGVADNAYELVTTLATLDEVFTRLIQSVSNKFPRHKLANDGTRFGPGQAIVTPLVVKAELVAQYILMEFDGLVENTTAFKNALIVERSPSEPNVLTCLYPPDLINQLRRFNVLGQFRLQFPG